MTILAAAREIGSTLVDSEPVHLLALKAASARAKAHARSEPLATIPPVHWPFLVRD